MKLIFFPIIILVFALLGIISFTILTIGSFFKMIGEIYFSIKAIYND
jgi:hypothetical protein